MVYRARDKLSGKICAIKKVLVVYYIFIILNYKFITIKVKIDR